MKKLRPYQLEGVDFLLGAKRGRILADDVGLGKTLTALTAAKRQQDKLKLKIIVICPAFVKSEWFKENKSVNADIEVYSWAKFPERINGDFILIGDESHYLQGLTSKRSRKFIKLSRSAYQIYLLTATPMINGKPINLFNQLHVCGCPIAEYLGEYEDKYCDAFWDVKGSRKFWNNGGFSNLDELKDECKPYILQRSKAMVAKDLPSLSRIKHYGQINTKQLNDVVNARRKQYLLDVELGDKSLDALPLVMLQFTRKALSIAKASITCQLVDTLSASQVVVFTEFVLSAELIANQLKEKGFRVALIHGGVPSSKRDALKSKFQKGGIDVWVATTNSSNVGLNLQCCNQVILHDRAYRIGDVNQAIGRCHRIGSLNPVTSYWVDCHKIDYIIDQYLETKQKIIDGVLGQDSDISEFDLMQDLFKVVN